MKYLPFLCLTSFLLLSACQEDPCENTVCLNGGSCVDGLGSCECQIGYEGDSCETFTFQLFLGSFEAEYGGCVDTPPGHRVEIEQKNGEETLLIRGLGDYACPGGTLVVEAQASGTALTIAEQAVDCGDILYTFSGSGAVDGNRITLSFVVTYDADGFIRTDQCTAVLSRE